MAVRHSAGIFDKVHSGFENCMPYIYCSFLAKTNNLLIISEW
jgi:hypothetical protein